MKKVKNALDKSALWCYNRHIISSKAMTKTDEEPSSQRVGEGVILTAEVFQAPITSELKVQTPRERSVDAFRDCRVSAYGLFDLEWRLKRNLSGTAG